MATFIVSFVIFASAAALLLLGQRLRRGPLPVGCTPGSAECCMSDDPTRGCASQAHESHVDFGNSIGPAGDRAGSLRKGVLHEFDPRKAANGRDAL